MKKLFLVFSALLTALFLVSCWNPDVNAPGSTELSFIYPAELNIYLGETDMLTARVYNGPVSMDKIAVEWVSDDPGIVEVNPLTGNLKALQEGETVIRIKVNGQILKCESKIEVLGKNAAGTLFIEDEYIGGGGNNDFKRWLENVKHPELRLEDEREKITKMVFTKAKLTRADINYIKGTSGTNNNNIRPNNEPLNFRYLEELYIIGSASGPDLGYNEIGWNPNESKIDKDFGGLKKLVLYNTPELGAGAFQRSVSLEEIYARDTKKVAVRAFAMPQFSSESQLKSIRLPNLEEINLRTWYYNVSLEELELGKTPPVIFRTEDQEGREGLFFSYANPDVVIVVPDKKTYNDYMKVQSCVEVDWTAYKFRTLNNDYLAPVPKAPPYDDKKYDDFYKKNYSETDVSYYRGHIPIALNFYTFSRWLGVGNTRWVVPPVSGPWNLPTASAGSGTSASSTNGSISVPEVIRWAKDVGFEGVDVTGYYFEGYTNLDIPSPSQKSKLLERARETKAYAEALGIKITGTGIQNSFTDPNSTRREKDIERIKFYLDFAEEMGAPILRIFAGSPPPDWTRSGWESIVENRLVPCVQAVADYALEKQYKVKIAVQNHGDIISTANQTLYMHYLINRPNVGLINDTGYFHEFDVMDTSQYPWYEDVKKVLPATFNFQLKKKPAGAGTRAGWIDLEWLFRDIRSSSYATRKDSYGAPVTVPIEMLWGASGSDYGLDEELTDEEIKYYLTHPDEFNFGNQSLTGVYNETVWYMKKVRAAMESTKAENSNGPVGPGNKPKGHPSHKVYGDN